MRSAWVASLVGVALARPASAEPPPDRGLLAVGASAGFCKGATAGGQVEVAFAAGRSAWLHGGVGAGAVVYGIDWEGHGTADLEGHYLELRVGVEAHSRRRARAAAFLGADVGYRADASDNIHGRAAMLIPRVGVELGGQVVRTRLAVEALFAARRGERERADDDGLHAGAALDLAIGVQF